jgi:hypothetical protein
VASTSDNVKVIIGRGHEVIELPRDLVTTFEAAQRLERAYAQVRARSQQGHSAGRASRIRADELWDLAVRDELPDIDGIAAPIVTAIREDEAADAAFGAVATALTSARLAVESAARRTAGQIEAALAIAMAKLVEDVAPLRPLVAGIDATDARSVLRAGAESQKAMKKLLTLAVAYRSIRATQAAVAAVSRPPRRLTEYASFEEPERYRGSEGDDVGELLHNVSCRPVVRTASGEAAALQEVADQRRRDAPVPKIPSFRMAAANVGAGGE